MRGGDAFVALPSPIENEIERRLTAVESMSQQSYQEMKDVRSSLTLKGLR